MKTDGNIRHDEQGWWFDPFSTTGNHDWYGPYLTQKEAVEARASLKRNWSENFRPEQVCTGRKT